MQKILAILFGILLGTAVLAQDSARVTGVEETIQRQIEAFLVEDVDAAFAIASPTIQQLFGNASENFGRMVQMQVIRWSGTQALWPMLTNVRAPMR